MESLDLLANNLANAAAPGFKADREFYSTYLSAEACLSPGGDIGSLMPVVERQWTDFAQGDLTPTGNPLDVAIKGRGFFVALSNDGPLLTRDGALRLSTEGYLETRAGFRLRGNDGKPIQLDPSLDITFAPDGAVLQGGETVAQLDVADVKDLNTLVKHGMNYYDLPAPGTVAATTAELRQSTIESANSQPAESAVRLVSVMRQFEMLQRAVSIGADMNRRLMEQVARVTT